MLSYKELSHVERKLFYLMDRMQGAICVYDISDLKGLLADYDLLVDLIEKHHKEDINPYVLKVTSKLLLEVHNFAPIIWQVVKIINDYNKSLYYKNK